MKKTTSIKKQSGVVLVISMIMLLLLTLIGVTGTQVTTLEEKMAGNARDQNLAFQAAESALIDAENDIDNTVGALVPRINGSTGFDTNCTNGLCLNGTGAGFSSIWNDAAKVSNAVSFGTYTGASAIPGVALQPIYLIDAITSGTARYRITAIGYGGTQNAQRILEEIYIP